MGKWDGLEEFVAVVEAGSFSRAATRLEISTSRISREIASLEDRLQVRLLYRTTRRVGMTEAGRAFYDDCRRLVNERDEALRTAEKQAGEPAGPLRITCSVAYGERYIVPLVNRFARLYPRLQVDIELTNRLVDLVAEGYDLAIRLGRISESSFVATRLTSRSLYTCAAPAYLQRMEAPQTPSDLAHHDCLLGASEAWIFCEHKREISFKPKSHWRCNSGFAVLDAALTGLGICQLPDFYVNDHLASGALIPLLADYQSADQGIWALYPNRRHVPSKVSMLIDYLREGLPHRGGVGSS